MRRCTTLPAHRSAAARYCASPLRFLPPSPLDDSLLPSLPPAHLNVHQAVAGRQAARGAACGRSATPLAHPSPARPPPIPTHTGAGARPPPPPPEAGPRREGERAMVLPAAPHIKMQLYLDPIKTYPIYAMIEIAKFDWRESYHSTQTATRSSGIFSVVVGDGAGGGGKGCATRCAGLPPPDPRHIPRARPTGPRRGVLGPSARARARRARFAHRRALGPRAVVFGVGAPGLGASCTRGRERDRESERERCRAQLLSPWRR